MLGRNLQKLISRAFHEGIPADGVCTVLSYSPVTACCLAVFMFMRKGGNELTQPFIVNLRVVERVVWLSLGTETVVKIGTGLFFVVVDKCISEVPTVEILVFGQF